jgi:hypothetical protein
MDGEFEYRSGFIGEGCCFYKKMKIESVGDWWRVNGELIGLGCLGSDLVGKRYG